jgi:hypothetical protein
MEKCPYFKIEQSIPSNKEKWQTLGQVAPQQFPIPCCEHKEYPAKKNEMGSIPECNGEIGKDKRCPLLKYKK